MNAGETYTRTSEQGHRRRTGRRSRAQGTPRGSARIAAVRLLSRREYSAKELADALTLRGYASEAVEDAMTFCQEHELQSDERFARSRVRWRATRSNSAIARELARHHLSAELVEESLAELPDETERARELAQRRVTGNLHTPKDYHRAWRFLAGRGFSSSVIHRVLRELRSSLED